MSSGRASDSWLAHILLLAVVLVWGVTFSLVKSALTATTPLMFNLVRMALAFAVLAAVNWPSLRGMSRTDLKLGAAAGLLLGMGYQFQTTGLKFTTASKAAFLTGLVVVIVPLLSAIPGGRAAGVVEADVRYVRRRRRRVCGAGPADDTAGGGDGAVFGYWAGGVALPGVCGGVCGASADAGTGCACRFGEKVSDAADRVCHSGAADHATAGRAATLPWNSDAVDRARSYSRAGDGGSLYDPELGPNSICRPRILR